MRKIITVQFPADFTGSEVETENWTNKQIMDAYLEGKLDLIEDVVYFTSELGLTVIAVNDTVESEKPDGDSTGETNGPTGLYEVPC